jgi:hypothetical protein
MQSSASDEPFYVGVTYCGGSLNWLLLNKQFFFFRSTTTKHHPHIKNQAHHLNNKLNTSQQAIAESFQVALLSVGLAGCVVCFGVCLCVGLQVGCSVIRKHHKNFLISSCR